MVTEVEQASLACNAKSEVDNDTEIYHPSWNRKYMHAGRLVGLPNS